MPDIFPTGSDFDHDSILRHILSTLREMIVNLNGFIVNRYVPFRFHTGAPYALFLSHSPVPNGSCFTTDPSAKATGSSPCFCYILFYFNSLHIHSQHFQTAIENLLRSAMHETNAERVDFSTAQYQDYVRIFKGGFAIKSFQHGDHVAVQDPITLITQLNTMTISPGPE
jgi:hypothetical protein